jgi:hypothetical protein
MNKSPKEFFLALPNQQKMIFLARFLNDLTIHGRGFGLDLTGEIQIAAFKGLNELNIKSASTSRMEAILILVSLYGRFCRERLQIIGSRLI